MEANELTVAPPSAKPRDERRAVTVRLTGDSGDGMQLAGTQLASTSALGLPAAY